MQVYILNQQVGLRRNFHENDLPVGLNENKGKASINNDCVGIHIIEMNIPSFLYHSFLKRLRNGLRTQNL